nr:glycoside hydrolase family 97 catalytic domain-containing protein [uncultured Carboxylicivirga sp.]
MLCLSLQAQNKTISNPTNQLDTIYHDDVKVVMYSILKSTASTSHDYQLFSPDGNIELGVNIAVDQISYTVSKGASSILEPSILDLSISNGKLVSGVEILNVVNQNENEVIHFPYGERNTFENNYHEIVFNLKNKNGVYFNLRFRAYNQGIAFCFNFPESSSYNQLYINGETTQFSFATSLTAYAEPYNENGYTPKSVNSISRTLIPLTLTGSALSVCINEANNDHYARIGLKSVGNNTLQSIYLGSNKICDVPFSCPWRYMVIGEQPKDLIENKQMVYGLVEQSEENTSWIKPGKVYRCMQLTTEGAKNAIDFCDNMHFQYMMFDAGWYGLGYGQSRERDPSSDPTDVVDEINMEEVCAYAESKNIGVILYINKVGWNYYNNQTMLDLYASWGIKGIKLGFMDGYSATGVRQVYNIIKGAAKRNILVNVHDEFRFAGTNMKYPNLLTAEGIKGNESRSNTGDHTSLLPFTRFLSGAADYTFCFKGNDNKPTGLGTKKGHQLAISILFYSPLQHIFWYSLPTVYSVPVEVELFKEIPTVWDDYTVAAAHMGDYISMARQKGDVWYLASINDNISREFIVPLDFLDDQTNYAVTVYGDTDDDSIEKIKTTTDHMWSDGIITQEGLHVSLMASGGQVCKFEPKPSTGINDIKADSRFKVFPNPSNGIIKISDNTNGQLVSVTVVSVDGLKMYERKNVLLLEDGVIDLSMLKDGCYVLSIGTSNHVESHKIIISK